VKSAPMVAGTNDEGAVVKVFVTVKVPQSCWDAEPETLSYQSAAEEKAGTSTEVVIEGNEAAVIVAVVQGFT
jgi:hypothetical protein